tara:strand:+ start:343 stop:555 length:213 start_codon:yes stop_codon:yes gene_type:complete
MTKFNESDITTIQNYWKENKGIPLGNKIGGVHKKVKTVKKFGLQDLANHFKITEGQARRILYVKQNEQKD